MILASTVNDQVVDGAVKQIDSILRQRRRLGPEDEAPFAIRTQAEFRESQDAVFKTLTYLLVGVAAISLFVGGIGVMNIMLVGVTQRTREIGIRMAVGARPGVILMQFLAEAILLCLVGGGLGTALGAAVIFGLTRALDLPMTLPLPAVLTALAVSLSTGLIFGMWPARRASQLDPIAALHHE
jgi:putative ABC transport system permease protein